MHRVGLLPTSFTCPRRCCARVTLTQGASLRKASGAVHKTLGSDLLRASGFDVRDSNLYEHEVRRNLYLMFYFDACTPWCVPELHLARSTCAGAPAAALYGGRIHLRRRVDPIRYAMGVICLIPASDQIKDLIWALISVHNRAAVLQVPGCTFRGVTARQMLPRLPMRATLTHSSARQTAPLRWRRRGPLCGLSRQMRRSWPRLTGSRRRRRV